MRKNAKKSKASQKRGRRQRYIEAIDPLRQLFSCTTKEVHSAVMKLFKDKQDLEARLDAANKRIDELTQPVSCSNNLEMAQS